jgi:hypothetical protein
MKGSEDPAAFGNAREIRNLFEDSVAQSSTQPKLWTGMDNPLATDNAIMEEASRLARDLCCRRPRRNAALTSEVTSSEPLRGFLLKPVWLLMLLIATAALPPIASDAAAFSYQQLEVEARAGRTIPAPATWENEFPIPAGARSNESLGGATSLAPGRNFTIKVYDTEAAIEAMIAFYDYHLPAAKRERGVQEARFSGAGGHVKLSRRGKGTRITLTIGPR